MTRSNPITTADYNVVVLPDFAALKEWRGWPIDYARTAAKAAEMRTTVLVWHGVAGAPSRRFTWLCPGCGAVNLGTLGEEPVSGWEEPRWVNSGTDAVPTLTPSLGCPMWRAGRCVGHWWLRDGRLVLA